MKLSEVVSRAGEIARTNHVKIPLAAAMALNEAGCQRHRQQVSVTRIVNDIGAKETDSLITVVTRQLGKKGLETRAIRREEARQTEFTLA